MNDKSILNQANDWIKNSVMLKFLTITILMLLLLIPLFMVTDIIEEREELNEAAVSEVSAKWAGPQVINGPILVLPVDYSVAEEDKVRTETRFIHVLPHQLDIDGKISPQKLQRGIYEVVVYKSDLDIQGSFKLDIPIDSADLKRIRFKDAFITMGITDLRGIEDNMNFQWNNERLGVQPGSRIPQTIPSGVTVDLPDLTDIMEATIPFTLKLKLQGSQNMHFIPLGSTTNVALQSDWSSPSFTGNFIPDNREVTENGFSADWKILQLNRNFPQTWTGPMSFGKLEAAAFGLNLLLPLDDYQKAMRSAKYGVMTIALTFLVFFLVEILNKRKIHPFQYALVGLALCLFYILLVSLSEHMTFNNAYTVATLSIVSMITLYSLSVFRVKKLTMILALTLIAIYGFLFVTLQLADYALLMGSVGLTIILAMTMYFTRNINWYKLSISQG